MKKYKICNVLVCCWFLLASAMASDFSLRGTTDKEVAIYKVGEKMEFTLKLYDEDNVVVGKKIKWTRSGDDGKVENGEGITTEHGVKIVTSTDKPGFVRVKAFAFEDDGKNIVGYVGGWGANKNGDIFFDGGACVEPEKLKSVEEPNDFDSFWQKMKAELNEVPLSAKLKEVTPKDAKVKVFEVELDCAGPKPVTGYLTIPLNAKPKSLAAIVSFHGYGTGKHNVPAWLNEWNIVFDVNAHGMKLGQDDAYYAQLQKDLSGYCFNKDENSNRHKTYYYGMALRVMRALQYVKTLPEWNGKDLQSNGGSQGGLQGLWGAGLDADVTSCDIWSPWCCDLGGVNLGRQLGWRPDFTEAINYYDPVHHAKRIKGKVHLVANYGDYVCPPSGVWTVYNNIAHENKSMEVFQGCTHGYKMKNAMSYTYTPHGIEKIGIKK